jgi:hypothetical protein
MMKNRRFRLLHHGAAGASACGCFSVLLALTSYLMCLQAPGHDVGGEGVHSPRGITMVASMLALLVGGI